MKEFQHSSSLFFQTQSSLLGLKKLLKMSFYTCRVPTISNFNWRKIPAKSLALFWGRGREGGGGVGVARAIMNHQLEEKVKNWCSTLKSQNASPEKLLEGSKHFYQLILDVWSLDTSMAIDAAELVCDTLRYGQYTIA